MYEDQFINEGGVILINKFTHQLLVAAGIIGFASIGAAQAAGPSASMLANTCNACHGPDGSTYGPASPSISGVNPEYLADTMEAYKSGARKSTIMGRIMKGYSTEEIQLIAKHFSKKPLVRRVQQMADGGQVDKGQELFRQYCDACHEKDGYSGEDYPALAGQPMPYIAYQIADFLSGERDIDANQAMSSKEKKKKKRNMMDLKDAEGDKGFEAVMNFLGSRK